MPLVSAIIPNYNHAPFLRRRIDTVLNQTFRDFEVILLDDCSTDESRQIIESYRDHFLVSKIIYNEANSGSPFKQWNRGVKEARGTYVWLAESDDYADPRFLESVAARLGAEPPAGLAYCQSWQVDEQDRICGDWREHTRECSAYDWNADFTDEGRAFIQHCAIAKNPIPNASAVLFNREKYLRVGGADETFRLTGDWLLWLRMLSDSTIAYVAQPLNYFRTHPSNVRSTTRTARILREITKIHLWVAEQIPLNPPAQHQLMNLLVKNTLDLFLNSPITLAESKGLYLDVRKLNEAVVDRWMVRRLLKDKKVTLQFCKAFVRKLFSDGRD